jgi:hypothetical protein
LSLKKKPHSLVFDAVQAHREIAVNPWQHLSADVASDRGARANPIGLGDHGPQIGQATLPPGDMSGMHARNQG